MARRLLGDIVPIKWKPMITSIPYVVVVLLIKLMLDQLGHPGILDFSDLGIVYTGGVFLLGFNLAGTMADYKESERIPGELACIFETMEDSLKQAARQKPELDLDHCRRLHAATLSSIIAWLLRKESQQALYGEVANTIEVAYALDKAGAPQLGGRYVAELHNIRKSVTRMGVISRTTALESGFAFLQFLTAAIILLLLVSKFKNPLSEVILVSFVSLIYIYMLGLIRDIDDPFEYHPDGRRRGCAEVELFPLLEYQQRLQERLAQSKPPAREAVPQIKVEVKSGAHADPPPRGNRPQTSCPSTPTITPRWPARYKPQPKPAARTAQVPVSAAPARRRAARSNSGAA
ncbi:MAG: hypothetical protein QM769_03075 [Pseudoxanthomonas sp.]